MTDLAEIRLRADVTDPDVLLAWTTYGGALRDFTGWTLRLEIIDADTNELVATKTVGVNGGDGTGASNVVISFTAADLAPLVGERLRARPVAVLGAERAEFTIDGRRTLLPLVVLPPPT